MAEIKILCSTCRKINWIRGTNFSECKYKKRFISEFAEPCEHWLPSITTIRQKLERGKDNDDGKEK